MLANSPCPVCSGTENVKLTARTFDRREIAFADAYARKRLAVLHDLWFEGRDRISITQVMCATCGFLYYLPRPEIVDVRLKYEWLRNAGEDHGAAHDAAIQNERAVRLYDCVRRTSRVRTREVLDIGGGNGQLMTAFVENGSDCFIVDFNERPISGVERLGATVDAIRAERYFDLIICNHVLEHVADPVEFLRSAAAHLKPAGTLFVEVPMEVWGGNYIGREPVTHINWFVRGSLDRCLAEAGLSAVSPTRLTFYLHPSGRRHLAVQAWASLSETRADGILQSGASEACRFLQPSLAEKLRRKWHLRVSPELEARWRSQTAAA